MGGVGETVLRGMETHRLWTKGEEFTRRPKYSD